MRQPTEYEIVALLDRLVYPVDEDGVIKHYAVGYDPVKAKAYYERTKKLKGRRRGSSTDVLVSPSRGGSRDPRTGKTREQIAKGARERQRKELTERISKLSDRLQKLERLIQERETEERQKNSKAKAKEQRSAKEKDKPKTAAEKAEAARDAEKYRDKNQQKLKNKSDDKKSGGSSGSKKKGTGKHTASELRSRATKVRGQIAVAKQKLAAL